MDGRIIRAGIGIVALTIVLAWNLGAPRAEEDRPEVCGYVAVAVADVVATTMFVPTTTSTSATCTSKPCGVVWVGPSHSDPDAAADMLVCLKKFNP